jgi:hypothetical protein
MAIADAEALTGGWREVADTSLQFVRRVQPAAVSRA